MQPVAAVASRAGTTRPAQAGLVAAPVALAGLAVGAPPWAVRRRT